MSPIIHAHRLRVRYGETDQMGVVYHTNYLNWFEVGRTELIRNAGLTYRELEERGVLLPVTDASLSYKKPARYDDVVEIQTRVKELSAVRLAFAYDIIRVSDQELLASGETMHVFTNAELKPIRLSRTEPEVYAWLDAQYKGGE
ncbi:acyl-CoA thioester hydrolase [Brevibacillus agri]|uniref:Acyl-CoA thioester hydrolase n=1 Tax=Brevibacillus agri TaxID=51101 RepID=A0A3M8AFU3_9BACL|nr:thioesterase family protein [Brevibacillus agri]QAV15206.1 acyl-CoA thioesterase [Brevibacillus agri]RNB50048.1 acyl-CoA thioesterase [Brevibacillus agri]GED28638.1 acyl-CoA thioester hydrolase [Brevibacillus agri]